MEHGRGMEFVDLADDPAPFNHRIRLITPKVPGDGVDGRAIPLDWIHSIGQAIFLLTPGSTGPASAIGRALLWRHSGHANSLSGWSGSPLELCDPGNDGKGAQIFGFQNFEFMNYTFSFQEALDNDAEEVKRVLEKGIHPFYGSFLLPAAVLKSPIIVANARGEDGGGTLANESGGMGSSEGMGPSEGAGSSGRMGSSEGVGSSGGMGSSEGVGSSGGVGSSREQGSAEKGATEGGGVDEGVALGGEPNTGRDIGGGGE